MGWKKPSWLQKTQNAAQAGLNAVVNPVVKAGDVIAQATGLDKAKIPTPTLQNMGTPAPIKYVQDVAQGIGGGIKNVVEGVGDVIASPFDGNLEKGLGKIVQGAGGAITAPVAPIFGMNSSTPDKEPTTKTPPPKGYVPPKAPLKNYGNPPIDRAEETAGMQEGSPGTGIQVATGGAGVRTLPPDVPEKPLAPPGPASTPTPTPTPYSQQNKSAISLTGEETTEDQQARLRSVLAAIKKRKVPRKMGVM